MRRAWIRAKGDHLQTKITNRLPCLCGAHLEFARVVLHGNLHNGDRADDRQSLWAGQERVHLARQGNVANVSVDHNLGI